MSAEPLFHVAQPINEKTVGYAVRGYTMGAIRDGWIVFIDDHRRPPGDHLIGELCVVHTEDGQTLIRFLRKGRVRGTYDLLTETGPQMLDVPLVWAEPVTWIRPYKLTGEEVSELNKLGSAVA